MSGNHNVGVRTMFVTISLLCRIYTLVTLWVKPHVACSMSESCVLVSVDARWDVMDKTLCSPRLCMSTSLILVVH